MIEKFRFENGSVYKYDSNAHAYIFCGKLNGRSKKQFVSDYKEQKQHEVPDEYRDK